MVISGVAIIAGSSFNLFASNGSKHPRVKIGDGVNYVNDLKFITHNLAQVQFVTWEADD